MSKFGMCRDCGEQKELAVGFRCDECDKAMRNAFVKERYGSRYKQEHPDRVNKAESIAIQRPQRKEARKQQRAAWVAKNPDKVKTIVQRNTEKKRRLTVQLEAEFRTYLDTEEGREFLSKCSAF